jgi:CelD/BcsL family acetyltransferase involved in cellulose biosynthesis
MSPALRVDVLPAAALGEGERALWAEFVRAAPHLQSPFLSFEYAQAAGRVVPGAHVAVAHRGGEIAAFLPFQRRGSTLQPLGAPLTDYHGLVSRPGDAVNLETVVRGLNGAEYRFGALCTDRPPVGAEPGNACVADLSDGYAAYVAAQQARYGRWFKDMRRKGRGMEADFGPMTFSWERDPALLEWVLARKREQYRASRLHDVFACGWTERLLRTLWELPEGGCHGRLAVLRAGEHVVAATFNLHGPSEHYMWFPAYDAAAHRWSPGVFLYLKVIEAAAAEGCGVVDFGPSVTNGKRFLTAPGRPVYSGTVFGSRWREAASTAAERLLAPAPLVGELRARARRRFDVITACETDAVAWLGGAALAARRMLSSGRAAEMTAN